MSDRLASVFIPTIGRERQITADALKIAKIPYTLVIPNKSKLPYYGHGCSPCSAKGIRATRQWILDKCQDEKVIMMDDDLTFFTRTYDGETFRRSSPRDLHRMYYEINEFLDYYAHGGILGKFMSQSQPRNFKVNSKYYHVLAYNRCLFPNPSPKYRLEVGEDHDMNLQLLIAGCPNFVLTEFCKDEKEHAPGGCSVWRTKKLERKEALRLQKLFPDFVTVKGVRPRINWQKSIQAGLSSHPTRFPRLQE